MRLGFWNRLAIVGTVLFCLIGPSAIWLRDAQQAEKRQEAYYTICMDLARQLQKSDGYEAYSKQERQCWKERFEMPHYRPGWALWREAFGACLLLSAVFYLFTAGCVFVVRWVWAGRAKNTDTA